MSLLKQLAMKKSAIGAVMEKKDESKAEAPSPKSGEAPAGKVDSQVPPAQGKEAGQASSILGALRTRSGAEDAHQRSGTDVSEYNAGVNVGVPNASSALTTKPSLLASVAAREKTEKAKQDYEHLFQEIPQDFQKTLDVFDELMNRDQGSIDFNLDRARDFVKKIMMELKENPAEYDGMIIDRDVRNIIDYQRRLKAQAQALIVDKTEKAAKRAAKPKPASRFNMDFANLDLGGSKPPDSLEDLSKIEFDL